MLQKNPKVCTFFSLTRLILIVAICCFAGCTKVQPWQKGNLARSHMAFDPNPVQSQFEQHVYQSKEGTGGGYGVGGGGCGCN